MLRSLSGDALRRLAASWPTERSLAELIVAEAIAEALAAREGAEVPACGGTLLPFGRHDWHLLARAAA
jgi:hypothetical protein